MISVYPKFYTKFFCKGKDCQHTCCQTWEIDIDQASLTKYQTLSRELGDDLRHSISETDGTHHFLLNQEGYCQLLENGLCRLVKAGGEDLLCDICHMHPRFFKYLEDLELCGLGLACEATCQLLNQEAGPKLTFIAMGDAKNQELSQLLEQTFAGTRSSAIEKQLADIVSSCREGNLQDLFGELGLFLSDADALFEPCPNGEDYALMASMLNKTEPINQAWTDSIHWLMLHPHEAAAKARAYQEMYDKNLFHRFYQYVMYRQIDMLVDYSLESLLAYGRDAAEYVFIMSALHGNPLEQMARWSEQIEYDTDNVGILLDQYESAFEMADM